MTGVILVQSHRHEFNFIKLLLADMLLCTAIFNVDLTVKTKQRRIRNVWNICNKQMLSAFHNFVTEKIVITDTAAHLHECYHVMFNFFVE